MKIRKHKNIEKLMKSVDSEWLTELIASEILKTKISPTYQDLREFAVHLFKEGVNWMAEQGVSVDGEFGIHGVEMESIVNELLSGGFKMGDKVIVQIRKK